MNSPRPPQRPLRGGSDESKLGGGEEERGEARARRFAAQLNAAYTIIQF